MELFNSRICDLFDLNDDTLEKNDIREGLNNLILKNYGGGGAPMPFTQQEVDYCLDALVSEDKAQVDEGKVYRV
jgi:hypothetical protein